MKSAIYLFLSSILCSGADVRPEQYHMTSEGRQLFLMTMSLSANIREHIGNSGSPVDVCTWLGVGCVDSLVTKLHIVLNLARRSMRDSWVLEMYWLPPTLRFVHLQMVKIPGVWATDRLPREMRYLYLKFCFDRVMNPQRYFEYHVDLRRLPNKMEELIVISSTIGRTIDLRQLPETMRLVYIKHHPGSIDTICIDYESLPDALEYAYIIPFKGDMRRKVLQSGKPTRVELKTRYDRFMPRMGSAFMDMFQ